MLKFIAGGEIVGAVGGLAAGIYYANAFVRSCDIENYFAVASAYVALTAFLSATGLLAGAFAGIESFSLVGLNESYSRKKSNKLEQTVSGGSDDNSS